MLLGYNNLARLTKYSTIAILAIVILSVIILNIVASYSNTKTQAGAEPTATLATNVNGAASISLSIHSATDSCDTSTPANPDGDICMQIPDGGGLAVGRHTIGVTTNSYAGYSVTVEGSGSSTDMSAPDFGTGTSSNNELIKSTTAPIANPSTLSTNTWGIAIPGKQGYNDEATYNAGITNPNDESTQTTLATATFGSVPPKLSGETIMSSNQATGTNHDGSSSDSQNIYYGANIDQFFRAGSYSEEVVYTATALLPPTPSNLSVSPTTFEFDSCNDSLITIEGTNLSSAYEVYLQKSGTTDEVNRLECTNLDVESNAKLTCNIPTSRDEVELNTTYDIYVISQAASPGILQNAFTYTKPATGISVKSTSENIIVDYDENLIPVVYVGYNGNGGGHWESLTKSEIADNTGNWFNYAKKQWANAVTVTKDSLSKYQDKHTTIDNNDVMGYWVYIPRYAYEVQRRDATDKNVGPQNFDIVFQTADEKNTPIATSSTGTNHKDYRTSNSSHRTYSPGTASNPNSNTTWATHPAFSWGDTELNGIWVGKYETTGKISAPTVKPNQHANISEYIGEFYTMSKSIGKEDKCNVGGNTISGIKQNSHNLATTKSHMLKNSEWGAITYLAHSKYGAGINTSYTRKSNVSKNGAVSKGSADADGNPDSYGYSAATGCGPSAAGNTGSYAVSTKLDKDTIESDLACGSADKAYNGETGTKASTTNTVYGVYDIAGGVSEYVMGSRTSSTTESDSSNYMSKAAVPPYVDLYVIKPNGPFYDKPDWSSNSDESWYNYDICTFETCGGTATYETTTVQSVSGDYQSWGGAYSRFVYKYNPLFYRGSDSSDSYTSPFYTYRSTGSNSTNYTNFGSRAALLALPTGQ